MDGAHLYPNGLETWDDVRGLFADWILPGHVPERPMLDPGDSVITLGSCFARELRRFLDAAGFSATNFWVPSGLNNTFALADFVSWCATGTSSARAYRYERDRGGEIREWTPEVERREYEQALRSAGCFVFTIGLAEVWEDSVTGGSFWRGVPDDVFEAGRHVLRLTTVDENVENILSLITSVRAVNESAPIVLTLSPVPLQATFRDMSCVTADAVSKSVLRVALDTVVSQGLSAVYYWPSFELVRWAGPVVDQRAYGDPDARHPSRYLVNVIVEEFVRAFYGEAAATTFCERLAATRMRVRPPHPVRRTLRGAERFGRRVVARAARELGRA